MQFHLHNTDLFVFVLLQLTVLIPVVNFYTVLLRLTFDLFTQIFWNAGCQMVALNFQTLGKCFQCWDMLFIVLQARFTLS
jgi:hypothetical protein